MNVESVGAPSNVPAPRANPKDDTLPGRTEGTAKDDPSSVSNSRQTLNKAILTASMQVSLSAGDNSMTLLYKSAIDHINKVLAPELGDNAIQEAYKSGLDVSPQATADRIVSMSTAFFGKYAESNPDKDLETALKDFTALIGGGIDQGFSEARTILDGLKVLQGDIASNIDKTYELVQTGLKAFADNYPRPDKAVPDAAKADGAPAA